MDQILHKCGLLEVRAICLESERERRTGIKWRRIGNDVAEIFVQKYIVGLDSEFPFVPPMIDGTDALEISLAKPVVLKHLDGS